MKIIKNIIIILILTVPNISFATDYFIDSKNGNDSWDGKFPHHQEGSAGPWKSLAKINSVIIKAGDAIKLKCGEIWYETLTINFSGNDGNPITVTSYGTGDKPVIHGGTPIDSWSGPDQNGCYYKSDITYCHWFLEDDIALRKGKTKELHEGAGTWFFDGKTSTIFYKPTKGKPSEHRTHRIARGSAISFQSSTSYLIIDNLKMIGLGIYKGIGEYGLDNIIIKNCEINNNYQGIYLVRGSYKSSLNNIHILNCKFDYCRHNIYLVDQVKPFYGFRNIVFSRNKITHSNGLKSGKRWIETGDADGFSLQNVRDSIFEYNDISGHCDGIAGITIWNAVGANITGNIIRYNHIHDIKGAGIAFGAGSSAETKRNVFIYGNIIRNYGTGDAPPYGGIRINGPQTDYSPSKIYNNTIINGDIGIYLYTNPNNYIIKNNIIYKMKNYIIKSNVSINKNKIDNNCYDSLKRNMFQIRGKDYTFAQWRSITGQDKRSFTDNPYFVDERQGDFRLKKESPCITAGDSGGPQIDYQGKTFRKKPSIGAIEY